ncbi:putative ABC transport system permease protein [Streptomyces sp. LamerLS-316]|uniref:ABC transporter permease n=1 Tax=unclassified Streptomyces TaxID=2593676 RepID=UPI000823B01B|nr:MULTISPECIES: ABC transporter permease [unclassified Streptomyces]MYQ41884.1 FtsX-like permease family protein [Streptomyces sp. SID4921]SCK29001.1 putative ABC transport system permease protein [Streptomyces sp. LamerLS-316]
MTNPFRRRRGVPLSRFLPRDLVSEALAGMLQRPMRSVLTGLGTVLGVGTFVAVLGLTATTSSQIDSRFDTLTATEVTVEDTGGSDAGEVANSFPEDADARLGRLNGVRAAGVYWTVASEQARTVRAAPVATGGNEEPTRIVAASAGVLRAAGPELAQGRVFDAFHERTGQEVVVLGAGVAARLGITTLETRPAVFIGERPFLVIGILDDVDRRSELLLSVIVPRTVAERLWGPPAAGDRAKMLVSTDMGAARQIAEEAALALDPAHPDRFRSTPPPDPRKLRNSVTSDLDQLFLVLAGICLVIGAVGIANTTLVAVLERTGEIGLRRALGARGRHVTAQFLAESGALGALGGLVGTSLGTATVVIVALAKEWTPVVHPGTVAAAPLAGLVTGVLAGLYPAWRASRIEPAEALRR